MPEFIFMLTRDDRVIEDALSVYRQVQATKLRYVGFKDIGLPFEQLNDLAVAIQANGQKVMLEMVSERKEDELRSAQAAIEMGVDYLLGGVHAEQVTRMLAGTAIRYFPFAGHVIGHPSRLRGSIAEIVESARRLVSLDGVHGLDLLTYRYDGDAQKLAQAVVRAVDLPVIAAGSIDSDEKIQRLSEAGVWGFTIGSAFFNETYPAGNASICEKVTSVLQLVSRV